MKILVTGGSGLLGLELQKLDSELLLVPHTELDVCDPASIRLAFEKYSPDTVVHLAAAMRPPEHEKNPAPGLSVNIIGTANIALACLECGIRLVYASSDYVYTGKGPHRETEAVLPSGNFYWSKLGGECAVRVVPNSLVLRLSFGPAPFPYDAVYAEQWTSKVYVDEIAPLVLAAVKSSAVGTLNLGGPRVTLESYAKRTRPEIKTIPRPDHIPADVSLDISQMKSVLEISDEVRLLKHFS